MTDVTINDNTPIVEQKTEIEQLQTAFREFIRVVNGCDTVCPLGSVCLCDVEYNLWTMKE